MQRSEVLRKALAQYLKDRRLYLKKSQGHVSKRLGFSAQFYGKIEKGEVPCPPDALRKLIKILQLNYSEIENIYILAAKQEVARLIRD